jgi:hypothetical protein
MEFRSIFVTSTKSTLRWCWLPSRVVPVYSQLIILSPFLRVAEDFVGLVDFLELFFGRSFVFGFVRVIL